MLQGFTWGWGGVNGKSTFFHGYIIMEERKAVNDNLHLSQLMIVEYGFSHFESAKN